MLEGDLGEIIGESMLAGSPVMFVRILAASDASCAVASRALLSMLMSSLSPFCLLPASRSFPPYSACLLKCGPLTPFSSPSGRPPQKRSPCPLYPQALHQRCGSIRPLTPAIQRLPSTIRSRSFPGSVFPPTGAGTNGLVRGREMTEIDVEGK